MKLYDLTTNHLCNPLGTEERPYFSWKLESEKTNVLQAAWRIVVYPETGDAVWDSGVRSGGENAFHIYAGAPLKSRTRYFWAATVTDNHGESDTQQAWFETGIAPEEWQAQWMAVGRPAPGRRKGFGNQPPATLFRRAFALKKPVKSARLYATCRGVYRLYVNGMRPDDREFAPEHTSYRGYHCYQTYDVTDLLREGDNVIGFEVGDGWYCCPQTKPPADGAEPDHAVLFQLEVTYADGEKDRICSDEAVLTSTGEVCFSDLFDGEMQDLRLAKQGWSLPSYGPEPADDADAPAGCVTRAEEPCGWQHAVPLDAPFSILHPQLDLPVRAVLTLPAKEVYTSCKGETIVDFGQVVAGRARIRAKLPAGGELTVWHFEAVDRDGSYYNSVQSAMGVTEQKDAFIGDGATKVFEAKFTFHGFRYLKVAGIKDPQPQQFEAVVLSTEETETGTFACSNPELNRLYENTRWSQRANMLSIPTDCPQREKAGWTGDISIYAKTALLNEDVTAFLSAWLRSLAVDQRENGSVPFTVPDTSMYHCSGIQMGESTGCGGPVCSAGWGDAAVTVPWAMYEVTGNTAILQAQYESMKAWCDYVISRAKIHAPGSTLPDEIEEHLWNTGFQFGEWLIPSQADEPQEHIFSTMAASAAYTAPICGWVVTDRMAKTARVLNRTQDADDYAQQADLMKRSIAAGLIDASGRMKNERQGAYAMMLGYDLVPQELVRPFGDRLAELIVENGGCLDTGFLATPVLLDALCKAGRQEAAYALLYQKKSPSWLSQIEKGATTIWESWEMYLPDGTPKNESFNHYAYGCVDDWMFRKIAGIDQEGAGFRHLIFAPQPDPSLTMAARTFETQNGAAAVEWTRADGIFTIRVTVPCNTDALIRLPDGTEYRVGSGEYTCSCEESL